MKQFVNIIVSFFIVYLVVGCEKEKSNMLSQYSFPLKELDTGDYEKSMCKNFSSKQIKIFLKHVNTAINLDNYEVAIRISGKFYSVESYQNGITLEYPYCKDDTSKIVTITIYCIDRKNETVYTWSKKSSYNLENCSEIFIKLNSNKDENYSIKLDNQWFYR